MNPIATVSDSNFTDIITSNGIYYYVIVAGNSVMNSSISNRDVVIVEISSIGEPLYPRLLQNLTWGGSGHEVGRDLALDDEGNIYVCGDTDSYGAVNNDLCLIKFNETGVVYNYTWGGDGDEYWGRIALDQFGNAYVVGWTDSFGDNDEDIYVVKFNSSGVEWNITWDKSEYDWGMDIALDANGNIYVTGNSDSGLYDLCLIKFNSEGIELWNKTDIPGMLDGMGIDIDNEGNIFVVGQGTYGGPGGIMVVKFDCNGNVLWDNIWEGAKAQIGYDITVDSEGNSYVTGYTENFGAGEQDICVVKFDAEGEIVWSHGWGGELWDSAHGIALDESGNIYVSGVTDASVVNENNLCLIKFDPDGGVIWSYIWGGSESDGGMGIALDQNGNAYICGYTENFGAEGQDLLLLKLLLDATPEAPVLNNIIPNPDHDGIIELNWSDVSEATEYYVYRSTTKMTSVEGLNPIATVSESNFTDIITSNGIYYYVIVAGNSVMNSSISNRDAVSIELPSGQLFLDILVQSFTEEEFNMTIYLTNDIRQKIEGAIINGKWNGEGVQVDSIHDLNNGLYSLCLTPITVSPGEDPIMLNITVSASGYTRESFLFYIAVDPATLDKGEPEDEDGGGNPGIPGFNEIMLIGMTCIISIVVIVILKKKNSLHHSSERYLPYQ